MYELEAEELIERLSHGGVSAWNDYRQNALSGENLHLTQRTEPPGNPGWFT